MRRSVLLRGRLFHSGNGTPCDSEIRIRCHNLVSSPITPPRQGSDFRFNTCAAWIQQIRHTSSSIAESRPRPPIHGYNRGPDGVKIIADWWISCYKNRSKTFESLVPLLRKQELWFGAYQKVCIDIVGSYSYESAYDKAVLYNLQTLSNAVLEKEFVWGGYGIIYIIAPSEKEVLDEMGSTRRQKYLRRIHSSPIFQDRIVQEVLLMILDPIYDSRFSPKSHAFRPGRDAHTALRVIRRSFPGYIWYFKGDATDSLHSVKPGLLMQAMYLAVKDKKILSLIKSGVMTEPPPTLPKKPKPKNKKEWSKRLSEGGPKPDPYWMETFFGFVPQEVENRPDWGACGALSSLLLNIYFDQLDRWMEKRIKEYLKTSPTDSIWNVEEEVMEEGDAFVQFVPAAPGVVKTRRMDYIRYGTQFLVGFRGPRSDAVEMRNRIVDFCENDLKLKLNEDAAKLVHVKKGVLFLDHLISRRVKQTFIRRTTPEGKFLREKVLGSVLSMTASLQACMVHLRKLKFLKGTMDAQPCFRLFHAPQSITNAQINNVLVHIAEWFRYADNRKKAVNFCQYILRSSVAKLYAAKYKLRSRAQVYKVGSGDLSLPIKDKKGLSEHFKRMMKKGFVEGEIPGIEFHKVSETPDVDLTPLPRNWMPEHEVLLRELAFMLQPECENMLKKQLEESATLTPQCNMSKILWSFFNGFYHIKLDMFDTNQIEKDNVNNLLLEALEPSQEEKHDASSENVDDAKVASL
ncbi:hypothetical protein KP509_16G062100 [Ceratopteris richardii]|uniref:Domain X domain-containing protein n=1 Tax=Ceratopteris richardii TaxID=49495 RepID=A0A8T2SZC8_CERRI|nr:hypothetical protein KP509_16G062100 [Ceratopteris richardii]KAH7388174.1 hypothetical protein KP509_16G062100 [Ceratopteris richardii]KAH7388175.1 hypothetical protein KP509_16G062100 [Ceratopteris richardii]KAH7388176.1 hypothetical protein KP509_16G062100 [Ceratopteris richardii]KAH7388177.1 hypothetical protein KP509_16G062100 [Ceratopteris richardii]